MEADIPSVAQLGVSGVIVGILLWQHLLLRADLKNAKAETKEARDDLLRCQAEKEDIMRDYMRKPHEFSAPPEPLP